MKLFILIIAVLFVFPMCVAHGGYTKYVNVNAAFDKPVIATGTHENVVVKVGLNALETNFTTRRMPINLAIVLDKSGSMGSQQKIENAKSGAIEIIERLSSNDIVALVVYDTHARVVIPSQQLNNKEYFIESIRRIRANGSTALYDGITFGAQEVHKNASSEYLNRILLLSDGLANVGPQGTPQIANLGTRLERQGISVTTVGVGLDYNEDLMAALAESGGGNTYFAKNSDRLPEIFSDEIGEAQTLAAQNIKIYLDCAKGIIPLGTIGRKGTIHGNTIELTINNLYGKNEKSALFEVQVPPSTRKGERKVGRVRVEYFDPFSQSTRKEDLALRIQYDPNQDIIEQAKNKPIIKKAALTRNSEIKQKAIVLADQGDYQQADALLEQQALGLEKVAQECDNDAELLKEASANKSTSSNIRKDKGISRFFRKRLKAESWGQIGEQYSPSYRK